MTELCARCGDEILPSSSPQPLPEWAVDQEDGTVVHYRCREWAHWGEPRSGEQLCLWL